MKACRSIPGLRLFYESKPDFFGFTPNPDGFGCRDLGLGNFLRSGPQLSRSQPAGLAIVAPTVDGQMQVMTARDVAHGTAAVPDHRGRGAGKPYFQKEFFHNGYIKSLKQLVHFYNTRDCPGIRRFPSLRGTARRERSRG